MYKCTHCKKEFDNEPFISSSNNKKYCSLKCIPDAGMDEPYSFEYFNLMESIRDIESRINDIETLEDRLEMEREIKELDQSYSLEIYGDDEGHFYKRQIRISLSTLEGLYNKIHNIFMERKIQLRHGVIVYVYELECTVGDDISYYIIEDFKKEIENYNFKNLKWSPPSKNFYFDLVRIKLSTETSESAKELSRVFKRSLNKFKNQMTKEQLDKLKNNYNEHPYCIGAYKLSKCVVCGEWEPWEYFSYNKELNLYKCDYWQECFEFDDYYDEEM